MYKQVFASLKEHTHVNTLTKYCENEQSPKDYNPQKHYHNNGAVEKAHDHTLPKHRLTLNMDWDLCQLDTLLCSQQHLETNC